MEGALGTPDIWFGSNNQDAGIPCAFQVFRPFQPLHTLVSYRGFHSRACPPVGAFSPSPRRASTAAGPPLRGRFSSLPKSFHSRRPAPAGAFFFTPEELPQPVPPLRGRFSSLPRSFHSLRPAPAGAFFFTPEYLPQPPVSPLRGRFFHPRGLPQPSFRPCGGVFSTPGSFHSRRFCGNFFVLYVYKTKKCFFRIHFLVQNMFSRVNKLVVSANSG